MAADDWSLDARKRQIDRDLRYWLSRRGDPPYLATQAALDEMWRAVHDPALGDSKQARAREEWQIAAYTASTWREMTERHDALGCEALNHIILERR